MRKPVVMGLLLGLFLVADVQAGRLEEYGRLGNQKSDRIERYGREYYKSHSGEVFYIARGKRGRKYARRFSLRENLRADKALIYDEFGYTPHRLGFYMGGKRTERWKYYAEGLEFVFDGASHLIDVRHFPPEDNHID